MTPDAPVTEDELHALIDGQLPPEREAAVRRHLADNPEEGRRIDTYIAHRETLRRAMADHASLPGGLRLSAIAAAAMQRRRGFTPRQVAAGLVVALGLGGALGWLLGQPGTPSRNAHAASVLASQAFATYAVFGADPAHPVEFSATELPSLSPYLSERLGRPANPPSLDAVGFHLVGGRIVATEYGSPAVLFVYQNEAGDRIGLLLRPMAPDLRWPVQRVAAHGVSGDAWIAHGMGYAVVGSEKSGDLGRLTHQVMKDVHSSG